MIILLVFWLTVARRLGRHQSKPHRFSVLALRGYP